MFVRNGRFPHHDADHQKGYRAMRPGRKCRGLTEAANYRRRDP